MIQITLWQRFLNREPSKEKIDIFSALKPNLKEFMEICILWCKENGESAIEITFS